MKKVSTDIRNRILLSAASGALLAAVLSIGIPVTAEAAVPAANGLSSPAFPDSQVSKLVQDAEAAMKNGNANLAVIQLKNAARLVPTNGTVRAQLGIALLKSGDAVTAERELRQAKADNGPLDVITPPLLQAMLSRGEMKDVLDEFRDPGAKPTDKNAADILRARAIALQSLGQAKEADDAMDRSLALRRDTLGLVTRAQFAQREGNHDQAMALVDEALKLSPQDMESLMLRVSLLRAGGDQAKALAAADAAIKIYPQSVLPKVARVEILLAMKDDAKASADVEAMLKRSPNLSVAQYYKAIILARAKDYKGAWFIAQSLPPEFVNSQAAVGTMVSQIGIASGNLESAGAILTSLIAQHPDAMQARLQLAALRLRQDSATNALSVLDPVKNSTEPSVQALLGQVYLKLRRYDDAIEALQKATATGSGATTDLLKRQLALSELQTGRSDDAVEDLRELADRDPGNAAAVGPLIAAYIRLNQYNEGLAAVDRMAKADPKSAFPAFYRGQILALQKKEDAAIQAFGQALTLDPKFVPALYYRSSVYLSLGRYDQATADLRKIVAQDPKNIIALIKLSEIAINTDNDAEVKSLLNQAIKIAPNNPLPRLTLANYYVYRHNLPEAQNVVKELLLVARNNAEALAMQGQLQLAAGQKEEAVKTYRLLTTLSPNSAAAEIFLGGALNLNGDQEGAERAFNRAVQLAPDSAQVRVALIDFQTARGKTNEAIAAARAFGMTHPGPDADLVLANAYIRLKRMDDASMVLTKSLAAKPDARVLTRAAQVAAATGDTKKALGLYTSWLAKNPADSEIRTQYGTLLLSTGNPAGAKKEFETVLKQKPDDAVAMNNLSWIIQKDDPKRALELATRSVQIAPRSPEMIDTLGWMKLNGADQPGALKLLQRAHDLDSNNPQIGYHLAVALDKSGKRSEAKALLQAVLTKNSTFDGAEDAKQLITRW